MENLVIYKEAAFNLSDILGETKDAHRRFCNDPNVRNRTRIQTFH